MTCEIQECAIRELAYTKWEQAGCPGGDGIGFWLEAEQEIIGQPSTNSIDAGDQSQEQGADRPQLKLSKTSGPLRKKAG